MKQGKFLARKEGTLTTYYFFPSEDSSILDSVPFSPEQFNEYLLTKGKLPSQENINIPLTKGQQSQVKGIHYE